MGRNINYKPISKDLEKMVKPNANSSSRPSLGLEEAVGEFFFIPTEDLIPFRNQARKVFDEEEIKILAESIKKHGIRQPLTVQPCERKYEVISGERRLRAAKLVGLDKVPCIILKDTVQADAIALIENIHRKDLHPIELGITYKNLLEKDIFLNQNDLAEKISVNKSQVSEYIKYAELGPEVHKIILQNKIFSRDKLRSIVKAHEINDHEKVKEILGITSIKNSNYSILRIISKQGSIQIQEKGLKKLSFNEKKELKEYLIKLIQNL